MPLRSNTILGLDIGQTTTKMVLLRRQGSQLKVLKTAVFSNWEEGIMSQEELASHLGDWLNEQGAEGHEITTGVPQYLTIVQLSDFPPASDQKLEEMVALETQQVAGLSDEAFLHDYIRIEPFSHYRNPALIAVCRESAVRSRLAPLQEYHLHVSELIIEGQALTLAYQHLIPAADQQDALHLVLDVGSENSTLIIMQNGQCVHMATFLAGGQTFSTAMGRHLKIGELEAEKAKRESRIIMGHLESPLTQAARQFVNELNSALESWHYQNQTEDNQPEEPLRLDRIYICGGGARLGGLQEYLASMFDCQVRNLQIKESEGDKGTLLPIAYGLAAATFAPPAETLSLAPPDLTWIAQRKRRTGIITAAFVCVLLTLLLALASAWYTENARSRHLTQLADQLGESRTLMQELEKTKAEVRQMQQMLIPFAARGNRNHTMNTAILQLGKYQQPGDWLVFLADEATYRTADSPASPPSTTRPQPTPLFGNGTSNGAEAKAYIPVTEIQPWRVLIASGFTPLNPDAPFENVSRTVQALNNEPDSIFTDVDTLTESQRSLSDFRIVPLWRETFDMKSFAIRLPLKQLDYQPENLD